MVCTATTQEVVVSKNPNTTKECDIIEVNNSQALQEVRKFH